MANFAEYHKERSDIFLSVLCVGRANQNNSSFCWTSQRTFWHFSLFCVWKWLILLNTTKNVLTFFYPFCVREWLSRTVQHFAECHKEHFSLRFVCGNGCPEQFIILLNITKNILTFFSPFCVQEWLSRTIYHFAEHHKEHSEIFLFCVWEWLILLNTTKNVLTFFYPFCVWEWLSRTIHHFAEHHNILTFFSPFLFAGMAVQNNSSFCWTPQRTFWHFSLRFVCGNGCPEQFIILLNVTKNILTFFSPFCVRGWLSRTIYHFAEHYKEHYQHMLMTLGQSLEENYADRHQGNWYRQDT